MENNTVDFDAIFGKTSSVLADVKDDFDNEPLENRFGTYGNLQLVGHGEVTNQFCGKFLRFDGCLRVELHNLTTLDGENRKGKIYRRTVRHFCNKPSCPVCFKSGWAIREAGNIEARLAEASKRFGLVEHIVASVPVRDYGLSHKDLRKKVVKILAERGILGGALIYHGFRYNLEKHWYFSPHFHVLGFVLGGFGRCRRCKNQKCLGGSNFNKCDGFEARTRKCFEDDGYIVKVLGKRKTVFGTAWYQLNHSSLDTSKRRFHVATWFGVCSYRKLKVTVEKRKALCPICQHDLVGIRYHGNKHLCVHERDSFDDYEEDGRVVWVERERKKYGSGSYEE